MTTPSSDEKLRDLERRFRQTGSPDDEAAWLLERVRVGDLTQERLELAAYCGHEGARATGLVSRTPWSAESLASVSLALRTYVVAALVDVFAESSFWPDRLADGLLAACRAWLRASVDRRAAGVCAVEVRRFLARASEAGHRGALATRSLANLGLGIAGEEADFPVHIELAIGGLRDIGAEQGLLQATAKHLLAVNAA